MAIDFEINQNKAPILVNIEKNIPFKEDYLNITETVLNLQNEIVNIRSDNVLNLINQMRVKINASLRETKMEFVEEYLLEMEKMIGVEKA